MISVSVSRFRAGAWLALCVVAAILVSTCASGCANGRGWTRKDTVAQVVFAAGLVVDAHQTLDWIAPTCQERNPIIGRCGERMPVPSYMLSVFTIELLAAWALPPDWRKWLEGVALGIEGTVIWSNDQTKKEQGRARTR